MLTETTQEILTIVDDAEERKKSMEASLKRLQKQKRKRGFMMFGNLLLLDRTEFNPGLSGTHRRFETLRNSRIIMDLNHRIVNQRNKFIKTSRAIGETIHWTSLSEHRSKRDRKEALKMAKQSASVEE